MRVAGGLVLLDTTFSNNPKVREDDSYQSSALKLSRVFASVGEFG